MGRERMTHVDTWNAFTVSRQRDWCSGVAICTAMKI